MGIMKKRVAAYIRVSTDSSDQENSYEIQERHFNQLLSGNSGWISAGIYSDYGLSGTNGKKRIGFRRLLRHCQEGRIDRVVCKSISRFARNTSDFMSALKIMSDHNVTILFEKEAVDTGEPASAFILTTLGAIAQEESRSISENIRWSMEKRFPRGDVRNQELYGYHYNGKILTTESGYQYKDIRIVEEEAAVIRRIFQLVAEGISYKKIARTFNIEGIPAPVSFYSERRKNNAARGQLYSEIEEGWTARHISQIVRRERYAGNVLIQKTYTSDYLTHQIRQNKGEVTQYFVENHHPAIVSRELYEKAQQVVRMNAGWYGRDADHRRVRGFSGRLICAECGRYYNVRNTRSNPIWYCPSITLNNGRAICHSQKIYEEQLIQMFRKAVGERFHLLVISGMDYGKVMDIIKGYCGPGSEMDIFLDTAADFVAQLLTRLEDIQHLDDIERERSFIKRQISAISMTNTRMRENIKQLKYRKNCMETEKYIQGNEHISDEEIMEVRDKLEIEKKRLTEEEAEERRLKEHIRYLEGYWEELEENFESREKAIEWMRQLPKGPDGVRAFMEGLTGEYIRAFALSINIHSPFKYTVHWFDDIRTEVAMDTNIAGMYNSLEERAVFFNDITESRDKLWNLQ